jgi:branched-chain amino acid transport system substrate-binding protein
MKFKMVAVSAAVALLASSGAYAQSKGTIKIVSHTPLSGALSLEGEAIKLGVQMAIDDFGKSVADQGFKLVLQPEDDQGTPNVGVANANRLINDADILGVVGHYNSGVAIPSSEVYAKVGLVMVSPANTNPAVTERATTAKIANRVCGRDDIQGPVAADYAVKTLKAKKVFIVNDKTAYGTGLAQAFEVAVKKAGVQVLLSTGVDEKETDFSAIVNQAAVMKPDVLFFGSAYPSYGLMIKQMRQKGVNAVLLAGDGVDSPDLQKIAGADAMKDVFFTTTAVPLNKLATGQKFAANYKQKFNKDPGSYSIFAYDSARAVIQGIAEAIKANKGNKPSREQVAEAVRHTKFDGLTGKIEFTAKGDIKVAKYVVVKAGTEAAKNEVISVLDFKAPE